MLLLFKTKTLERRAKWIVYIYIYIFYGLDANFFKGIKSIYLLGKPKVFLFINIIVNIDIFFNEIHH